MPKSTKPGPVHEIRIGAVKATIWQNDTSAGVRHNVNVARLYKDADDKWQQSDSFGRDDLLLVAKVVDQAHDWIYANA